MTRLKKLEHALTYFFVFDLGHKIATLSNTENVDGMQLLSIGFTLWFVGFFMYNAHKEDN